VRNEKREKNPTGARTARTKEDGATEKKLNGTYGWNSTSATIYEDDARMALVVAEDALDGSAQASVVAVIQ
jgi:hypothetical protein